MDAASLHTLQEIVQRNCHISDARYAAEYTLCIYLLKMREYYRWEKGLTPSAAIVSDEVGEWLTAREQLWEGLENEDYQPIVVNGVAHDPFAVEAINSQLLPLGLVYSAGFGRRGAAHFFLAELKEQKQDAAVLTLVSARELARDLTSPPAMSLGQTIFIRRESFRRMLWEKVQESEWARCDTPMKRAMRGYGFTQDPESALTQMMNQQMVLLEWHEQGEQAVEVLLGDAWAQMLLSSLAGQLEFLLRSIRDFLADCLVTLPRLLEINEPVRWHYYFSTLTPGQKQLFPALLEAYDHWLQVGDLAALDRLVEMGKAHWLRTISQLIDLHQQSGDWETDAQRLIDQSVLREQA